MPVPGSLAICSRQMPQLSISYTEKFVFVHTGRGVTTQTLAYVFPLDGNSLLCTSLFCPVLLVPERTELVPEMTAIVNADVSLSTEVLVLLFGYNRTLIPPPPPKKTKNKKNRIALYFRSWYKIKAQKSR